MTEWLLLIRKILHKFCSLAYTHFIISGYFFKKYRKNHNKKSETIQELFIHQHCRVGYWHGLASFIAEQRTKEIGIRKILGASATNIVTMLSNELIRLIIISVTLAWPIAWYAISSWLQHFVYRNNISWWSFLLSGTLALSIALVTIGVQASRVALLNPVNALRYE